MLSPKAFQLVKRIGRYGLAWLFVSTAVMHLVRPAPFVRIVPPYFPHALALVYMTGIAEALGALAFLAPRSRRLGSLGLIALLIAVFPANINMALHPERFRDIATPLFFWFRLPVQLVFIVWTAWCGDLFSQKPSATVSQR